MSVSTSALDFPQNEHRIEFEQHGDWRRIVVDGDGISEQTFGAEVVAYSPLIRAR
jgi:hypothetical protein